ncbi:MAG TPA: hypothetical protein VKA08_12830, partial [Balneolales bacterium]|nr:hypothetical protein [Balneolales bacterium]
DGLLINSSTYFRTTHSPLRNSRIPNAFGMLRFRSGSGFDLEQNPWFFKAFYDKIVKNQV